MARSVTVRRRCVEVVGEEACGRQFRPPVRDPDADRCVEHRPVVVLEAPPSDGLMVEAVRAELERCRALGKVEGVIALRLARALDDPSLAASAVASLSAQLTRTLEPLRAGAPRDPDRLDEITERIRARTGTA